MNILACDPGDITGLAFFSSASPKLIKILACNMQDAPKTVRSITGLDVLVIEQFPPSCESYLTNLYTDIERGSGARFIVPVRPAVWKPIARARVRSGRWPSYAPTQHEKDAIWMLRYYAEVILKVPIRKDVKVCLLQELPS